MNTGSTKLLKPKDVATLLQLNLLTIYSYIRNGKLPAVKFGRNFRIQEKDLEAFIKKSMVKVPTK